jgi:hypothetical protein
MCYADEQEKLLRGVTELWDQVGDVVSLVTMVASAMRNQQLSTPVYTIGSIVTALPSRVSTLSQRGGNQSGLGLAHNPTKGSLS